MSRHDLSAAKKYPDAWWTVVVIDPVAMRVLPHLIHRPRITPDRLSATSLGFAVLASLAFVTDHFAWGAVLFELRFFTDCLDGKLARVRGTSSARGAFVDNFCDLIGTAACFAACGYAAFDGTSYAGVALSAALLDVLYTWSTLHRSKAGMLDPDRPRTAGRQGRRFAPMPYGVDVEALTLFVLPLIGRTDVMRAGFLFATAFFALTTLRNLRITYKGLPA